MTKENKKSIEFTKEQYWNLLRATYMADWIANAICEADMKEDKGIKEIRNYIFSFSKEMGYEKFAKYDEEMKTYYATLDLDDEQITRKLIERYDDHTFWNELPERLGDRDFYNTYSKKDWEKMTQEERFLKLQECIIKWEEEMENNGIERIGVINSN